MDLLLAYLPEDRAHALASGAVLPDHTHGAALFADLSGFTPLTEALTQILGPRAGGEALTDQMNVVYTALTAAVAHWRGSVISFAGDAITCWFDTADGPASLRAAACGLALQAAMQPFASGTSRSGQTLSLTLKVAIATGPARRFIIGDPAVQRFDILAGTTLDRMAIGEHLAHPGEVLLDSATVATLGARAACGASRTDAATGVGFTLLQALTVVPPPTPWTPVMLTAAVLRPWILPAVWERHQAGLGAFLTELRPAVILFLRFAGLDVAPDARLDAQLDALIGHAQAVFAATGGTLLQITVGDKGAYLYATFGAPVAHEDDAARAARAALDLHAMVATLGLPPVQLGLSQGILRCGAYGGPTRHTYGVLGDNVNLAARLMAHAAPGETLLCGSVQASLGHTFMLEPRPPMRLKGKTEPLPLFALTGVVRRRAIRLQEPTYALPMVGRERERTIIEGCLERTLAGQGQVVVIQAEAGLGKSRLVAEVVLQVRKRGCIGYGGAAAASGTQTPFLAWRAVFQALLNVDPDAPLARQMRQLAGELADRVPQRAEAMPLLDLLLECALPENTFTQTLAPQDRKGAREALLVALVRQAAQEVGAHGGALLLVLEDAHWLDPLAYDVLLQVAQEAPTMPLLLLLAARPLEHPPAWGSLTALPHMTVVTLDRLDTTELEALIRAKLAQLFPSRMPTLPPGLLTALTTHAQGNPFYVEELLNYLRDRGVSPDAPEVLAGLDIPASLHRLVLARIDQLTERERVTLRVASVVGRLFRAAWLPRFVPDLGDLPRVKADLDRLARLELTPLDTPEPELIYLFKHVMTQEVVYASLPQTTRAQLHGALADWLAAQHPDHPPLDLLAYHYDHSDRLVQRRAALRQAGEAAAAQFANAAALDYLSRALALAPEDDSEERWALLWTREAVYDLLGQRPQQLADLQALDGLAGLLGEHRRRMEVAIRWSRYYELISDYPVAMAQAQHALKLADDDEAHQAAARQRWGAVLWLQGDYVGAQVQFEAALALVRKVGDVHLERVVLSGLGVVTFEQGFLSVATAFHEQALVVARAIAHRPGEVRALNNLGNIATDLGDYPTARTSYRQALTINQLIGDRQQEAVLLNNLGRVLFMQGDYVAAQTVYAQALSIFRTVSNRQSEAMVLNNLGLITGAQGDNQGAQSFSEQALGIARVIGAGFVEVLALMNLGYVLTAMRVSGQSVAILQEAIPRCSALGHLGMLAECRAGLAHALAIEGDRSGALTQVELVLSHLATGTLDGADVPMRAYLSCYMVLRVAGDARAERLLARAHAELMTQAARLDETDRQMFLEQGPWNPALVAAWAEQQAAC